MGKRLHWQPVLSRKMMAVQDGSPIRAGASGPLRGVVFGEDGFDLLP